MNVEDKIKIGLETHVQLSSDTKLLCGCPTTQTEDEPNTNVCPTCLGMPGARPRINKKVIEMGIKIAKALNCDIPDITNFSRKTYFYPDMPKNFQTTQFSKPLGKDGHLKLNLSGEKKKIRIKRIHIEEDPGRIKHSSDNISESDYTLLDYNRSGIPLCEVVTKPDLESPAEAREFLKKLTNILEHIKVYDSQSETSIRSDGNISMGSERVEIKNITGFKGLENALKFEVRRQKNRIEKGKDVVRETRSYDDEKQITRSLRQKEEEKDYGYIFDPDLTKVEITEQWVTEITQNLPELPHKKRERYIKNLNLSSEIADTICSDVELTECFEQLKQDINTDLAAKIISKQVKKVLNYNEAKLSETEIDTDKLTKVGKMLENDEITENNAELIIRKLANNDIDPRQIKEEENLGKVSGSKINNIIDEVIDENEEAVEDYKQGKDEALNFLMGQVMQKSQGSADPQQTRKLLKEELEE